MKMIVGLGNPGRKYENNRHNIGFRAVELYAQRYLIEIAKKQGKALIGMGWREKRPRAQCRGESKGETALNSAREKVLLVKPQTYMNNSGEAVVALAQYYQIEPADILVIHDDMDLPTGKLRLRPGGGAGGQKGVRSIINRLGTQAFPRFRVGIDRPPGRVDPAAYVLQDFQSKEAEIFGNLADVVIDIIDCWVFENIDTVMNKFNGRT